MEYELMNESHLQEIAQMYVETFNAPPWNDKWTVEKAFRRLQQMMNCEGFIGLVCFDENQLCGMIMGNSEQYFDCIHFNIKEFCVRMSMRGTGIGTKLLEEFEKYLLQKGVDEMYLFTSRTDQTEAFYQNRGFNSWNGMVMMGKSIRSDK